MKRKAITISTTLTALLALAACGGDDGGESASGSSEAGAARGPIEIWYSNNKAEIEWGKAMVESWNAEHPDEMVTASEIPASASSEEVIGAAITAGNTPCLIFNTSPAAIPQFQKAGGLVALDSFEDGGSYIAERTGDVAEQYKSDDGKFYQMPWKSNPVMIFYNKDLFTAAGLDPEAPSLSTYDEFLETSRTLVESGTATAAIWPSPEAQFFQPWFDFYPLFAAETGGTQLVEDGEPQFNSDEGLAVADFWATMYEEGLSPQEPYEGDAFGDAQSAMSIVGPWAIAAYDDTLNWGAVPVPTSGGTSPEDTWTFSDAKNTAMYSSCENQGTAWDVLKHATSEESDLSLLELTGQMPLRTDLTATYGDYFTENPAYESFADQAARTVEVPNVPNSVQIWQEFREGWSSSVIFGEEDPAAAFETVAESAASLAAES